MSEVQDSGEQNPEEQTAETQSPMPALDVQAKIQKALAEQQEAFERQLEEATGHRSLSDFLETQRQADEETRQRLDALSGEAAKFRTLYEQNAIKAAVLGASGEAINPEMVFNLLGGKAAVSEDGTVTVNGKPAHDAVSELLEQHPYLAKPRGSAGSGTPISGSWGASVLKNPWAKESFNLTEQARIFRENPAEAQRLKAAAGA
jgi:hypothetical protein